MRAMSGDEGTKEAGQDERVAPDGEREQCNCERKGQKEEGCQRAGSVEIAMAVRAVRAAVGRGGRGCKNSPAGATSKAFSVTFFKSECGK